MTWLALQCLEARTNPRQLLADRAYDARKLRDWLAQHTTKGRQLYKKWDTVEPRESNFFIRNGLLAYIAEKAR